MKAQNCFALVDLKYASRLDNLQKRQFFQVKVTAWNAGIAMVDYRIGPELTIHGLNMPSGFRRKFSVFTLEITFFHLRGRIRIAYHMFCNSSKKHHCLQNMRFSYWILRWFERLVCFH